jgi:hypothetical protein
MSQPFVILGHTRTGSNHLATLLNSHPDIECHGELLKPVGPPFSEFLNVIERMDARYQDPDYRRDNYEDFIKDYFRLSDGVIGFKLIVGQHNPSTAFCMLEPTIKVIYLYRENLLAVYSSEKLAKQGDQERSGPLKVGQTAIHRTTRFSKQEFEPRRQARANRHEFCYEILRRARDESTLLTLEYNELRRPSLNQDLLKFLSASGAEDLTPMCQKQNSDDILSRFSNPDDVTQYLEEIGRLDWIREGLATTSPPAMAESAAL